MAAGIALAKEAGGSVLTYDRARKQWHEFCRFGNASGEGGGPRLRDWHSPIMVGSKEMVQYLARFARHESLVEKVKGVFGGG